MYVQTLSHCKALSNTIALGVEDTIPTEKEDAMTATITKEATAWKLPDWTPSTTARNSAP